MSTNKLVHTSIIALSALTFVAIPAARAATLPMSIKGLECGTEDSIIVWTTGGNTSNQGFAGSKLTAITVAVSSSAPESVGIFAQMQQLPQPPKTSTGFRSFSAFVQDSSAGRQSFAHAKARFRFRFSDNSVFVSTKNLTLMEDGLKVSCPAVIVMSPN